MVKWAFSRWRYSKASRWRVGGKPASAPAMSKPATPRSRHAIGELGDLHRPRLVAHRGQQLAYDDPAAARGHPGVEALLHRRDDLVEGQPAADVLLGGVAHLGVDDAVGGEVLDALAGDPGDRRPVLHDRDGVVEGLEVAHQRAGVGRLGEPATRATPRRRPAARGRSPRRAPRSSAGAARRRGGRAAGPWGRPCTWSRVGVLIGTSKQARQVKHYVRAHAHLHHARRGRRRRRVRDRHQRVARRSTRPASTPSPTPPSTTSGSTSTSRRRARARSAPPSRTAS